MNTMYPFKPPSERSADVKLPSIWLNKEQRRPLPRDLGHPFSFLFLTSFSLLVHSLIVAVLFSTHFCPCPHWLYPEYPEPKRACTCTTSLLRLRLHGVEWTVGSLQNDCWLVTCGRTVGDKHYKAYAGFRHVPHQREKHSAFFLILLKL